jgi:hypothetical protein
MLDTRSKKSFLAGSDFSDNPQRPRFAGEQRHHFLTFRFSASLYRPHRPCVMAAELEYAGSSGDIGMNWFVRTTDVAISTEACWCGNHNISSVLNDAGHPQ